MVIDLVAVGFGWLSAYYNVRIRVIAALQIDGVIIIVRFACCGGLSATFSDEIDF